MGQIILKKQPSGIQFIIKVQNQIIATSQQCFRDKGECSQCLHRLFAQLNPANVEDTTATLVSSCSYPKFEIFSPTPHCYAFRLKTSPEEILAVSLIHHDKVSCINAIDAFSKCLVIG